MLCEPRLIVPGPRSGPGIGSGVPSENAPRSLWAIREPSGFVIGTGAIAIGLAPSAAVVHMALLLRLFSELGPTRRGVVILSPPISRKLPLVPSSSSVAQRERICHSLDANRACMPSVVDSASVATAFGSAPRGAKGANLLGFVCRCAFGDTPACLPSPPSWNLFETATRRHMNSVLRGSSAAKVSGSSMSSGGGSDATTTWCVSARIASFTKSCVADRNAWKHSSPTGPVVLTARTTPSTATVLTWEDLCWQPWKMSGSTNDLRKIPLS
mmetsp:Transcript_44110/g.99407  ORF Transcript_44110/g.99407 Transcript_44110/m.99407 type:complete len:270 (-) Transcript_44110:855-1664(-)